MDVLRPPIVTLNGICYRKNPKTLIRFKTAEEEDDDAEFVDPRGDDDDDEVCDAGLNVRETARGFELSVHVAPAYFKFIIGAKGVVKKRLEIETRTQLRIPGRGVEEDIVVAGSERRGVISARTRILLIVDGAKRKLPFTHFVSLPLNSREMQEQLAEFKGDVLRECDEDRGMNFSLFQHPAKVHLTLGTMVLSDEAEIEEARKALRWCHEEILRPLTQDQGLKISVRGLEYMNDDPSEVDVLYAQIKMTDGSEVLQTVADRVVDHLRGAGLMSQQYDRVKIHATVLNTLFRRDPSGTDVPALHGDAKGPVRQNRESFDATKLLKLFEDHHFGDHVLDEIHLSTRYSTGPDGYYLPAFKIKM